MTHADPGKLHELHERGFALVPGVLAPADIPELRRLLEKCIAEDLDQWRGKPYPDA
jgi:hypothetical protein